MSERTFHLDDEVGRLALDIKVCEDGTLRIYQLIQDGPFRGHWRDYHINEQGGIGAGMMMACSTGTHGLYPEDPSETYKNLPPVDQPPPWEGPGGQA